MIKAEPSFSLADDLFNPTTVAELAGALRSADATFRSVPFRRQVLKRFPDLTLKARIGWIVTVLEEHLPGELPAAMGILRRALPEPLDPTRTDDDFGRYIWVVPGEYVARHGCTAEHLTASLEFLKEATKRFTSEGAIRPFLQHFPDQTMAAVRQWTDDGNYHVRRLTSEGIRPFLPWAPRVMLQAGDIVDVLDRLHADPTRYVTRSVANTLNDLSKTDPGIVFRTLTRWRQMDRQAPAELEWMTRHALRTLVRQGNAHALELLGYPSRARVRISAVDASDRVAVGGSFSWSCRLTSRADQRLDIQLRIHYVKANGSRSAKTFKVRNVHAARGERLMITKRHPFRPVTTRVLYPGTHVAELVVNGRVCARREFELEV